MGYAVVAIGTNIRPEYHLEAALAHLSRRTKLLALSHVYETPPVGAPGTPFFLNAAVLLRTELPPDRFITDILRPIEHVLGRRRTPNPNAPRTIDLDLVLYSTSPEKAEWWDPQVVQYAHVALPVAEVVPEWKVPQGPYEGRTLKEVARVLAPHARAFRQRQDVEQRLRARLPELDAPASVSE